MKTPIESPAMDRVKETNYWLDPPMLTAYPDRPPEKTQVLIVGGGFTGMTAAVRLVQSGFEVTVIDAKPMGTGASARNGGMVLTGLTENPFKVIKRYGLETARRLSIESVEAVEAVARLVREGGIDCGFRHTGHLTAAFKPGHLDGLKRLQDMMAEHFDQNTRLLTAAETEEEIGSRLYHGALFEHLGGGVHPARYVAGLIKMAQGLGVGLYENVMARRIDKLHGGYKVITDKGSVRAEQVVIATNGYTGRPTPWLRRRIVAVRSLMIATELLPSDLIRSLIPNDRMISDTKIFLYYFRRSPDQQRLLFGGRPPFPGRSLLENGRAMRQNMLTVYPQLEPYRIDHVWWGKLGFTMDRLPHIGRHEGLYYAMGYCGHGVALATHLGEKLAGTVMDPKTSSAFSIPKFRLIPLYNGRPWFLPIVYRYFSLKDRFS